MWKQINRRTRILEIPVVPPRFDIMRRPLLRARLVISRTDALRYRVYFEDIPAKRRGGFKATFSDLKTAQSVAEQFWAHHVRRMETATMTTDPKPRPDEDAPIQPPYPSDPLPEPDPLDEAGDELVTDDEEDETDDE